MLSKNNIQESFNYLLPYLENNIIFIEKELFDFFCKKIQFKTKEGFLYDKEVIGFKIFKSSNKIFHYIDINFLEKNGNTHYNTFALYDYTQKIWAIFWSNLTEEDKINICNYLKNSFTRKIKIYNMLNVK